MTSDRTEPLILVVEDEAIVRLMAVDMFEEAGFQVIEAASGEKALALINSCNLAALFTDVELANSIDGFDLARAVRNTHPDAPIIVVSGQRRAKDGDLPEGACFFAKPYAPDHMVTTLKIMIAAADAKCDD